jgi:hypothetical protein
MPTKLKSSPKKSALRRSKLHKSKSHSKKRVLHKKSPVRKLKSKLKINEFYCVSCRKRVSIKHNDEIFLQESKNGRLRLVSNCSGCEHKLFKFVKESSLNTLEKKFHWC